MNCELQFILRLRVIFSMRVTSKCLLHRLRVIFVCELRVSTILVNFLRKIGKFQNMETFTEGSSTNFYKFPLILFS